MLCFGVIPQENTTLSKMASTRRATKPVGYYAALNALSSADMFEKGQPATLESDDENVFLVDRIIAERHRRKVRNNHTYCPLNSQLQCRFWEVVAEVAYVSFLSFGETTLRRTRVGCLNLTSPQLRYSECSYQTELAKSEWLCFVADTFMILNRTIVLF